MCEQLFPSMIFLPCHEPKSNGASQPWTETSETVSQNLSFLKLFSQVFCSSDKKLANIENWYTEVGLLL
jgi:hypothetical protein